MDKGKSEPKVTFVIEIRSANTLQKEAGKRLFSKLLAKAQSFIDANQETKQFETKT